MESILNETISKLEKRQDAIHNEEEKQELAISHLEEEIKQLESEKKQAEDKKAELEAEDKKIKTNITQLDKMKAGAEVKPSPKAKK
jgi:chromosome segregation ATPase